MSKELTADRLRELLCYDPESGVFTRRIGVKGAAAGSVAGYKDGYGYIVIMIDYSPYKAHRLAFLYLLGRWPAEDVDHKDGRRDNNMFRNLRECTRSENMQNREQHNPNNRSSGLTGSSWDRRKGLWLAYIDANNVRHNLGYFDTPEAAHAAYLAAKKQLHTFNPVPRTTTTGTSANDSTFTTTSATRRHRT